MYNKQLDTFMKVAELGSFSKAAESMYITPSAVVQQINNLESNLNVKLLKRTQRGVSLTPAGEILQREGTKLIEISADIRTRLDALQERGKQEICVGSSPMEQCHLFYHWWRVFAEGDTEYQVKMKSLVSIGDAQQRVGVDLVEGVYVGEVYEDEITFLPLTTVPIVHAVWKGHPLAKKKILRYEDMAGQTLMTLEGDGLMGHIKGLRQAAEEHGIHIVTRKYYDISVFTTCAINGYVLQMPLSGKYAHSELVAIPCDWDHTVPYGFYYRKKASPLVHRFITFMEQQAALGNVTLDLEGK